MAKKVLTYRFSEPLPGGMAATVVIDAFTANLTVDALTGGLELASGALQYIENQEPPTLSVKASGSQTALTLKSGSKGQSWLRLPWAACSGATEWHIHLTPSVLLDLEAHSGGGNVRLDLTGLKVARLTADTGGGNLEVILPDQVEGLPVAVKSGAGNVTVHLPGGTAARIHATTGLGKVIMEGPYHQIDKSTYQSQGYENAVEKIEISASSGAGNVVIKEMAPAGIRI